MDLVSIGDIENSLTITYMLFAESEWEQRLISRKIRETGAVSVWTSGHICDDQVSVVSDQCLVS